MGLTTHGKNTALTASLSTVTHVALFAGATELAGNGYTRQLITFDPVANGSSKNTSDVLFGPATSNWGNVTHVGLFTAATGGNEVWHGALDGNKAISTDDELKIGAGRLTVGIG